MYGYALIFSLTGYLGIQIVLTLVRTCGAFVAVTVTTCRKAVTIIVSFLFFSKPFTFQYLWSGLLVVLGIYLNLYSKRHPLTLSDLEVMIERCIRTIKLKIYSKRHTRHYMANV
jgi:adenosine 3'-phospho 5'-phosphosulfate transporter B3